MPAIVVTRSASMPSSCKGHYRKVVVLEVPYWKAWQEGWEPRQATERDKDVYRVLWNLGPQSVGKTDRCAYRRAIAAAEKYAEAFNNGDEREMADAEALIGAGGSA